MYIDYKKQPTDMSCGQTCVAMILWKSVDEISSIMNKYGGTYTKDLAKVFDFYGIPTSKRLIRKSVEKALPNLCIVKLKHPDVKGTHWSVFHDGVFYDPAIGMIEKYDNNVKILSYLEIYKEPNIDYDVHLGNKN